MAKRIDLTGQSFYRWTVLEFAETRNHRAFWLCRCECGAVRAVNGKDLRMGKTKSCGCLHKEIVGNTFRTHGRTKTSEYRTWQRMKTACTNPKSQDFKNYGGRGIQMCERWLNSFENFLADMGKRPDNLEIERIDNNGDYTPENCKWASEIEQANNKRNNHIISAFGTNLTIAQWSRKQGIPRERIKDRLRRGWPPEKALSQ